MHGSSQMSCPPMNGQPSQGFPIDNSHGSQPPSLQSQEAAKKRKVSRRGTAFSKEEDLVVCSAFLNISKNPIIGVDQTSGGYYKRMHDFFNKHKPEGSNRSQIAVQHRWALIQKAMNKFCRHKAAIDRLNESGKNEQDRIDDAVAAYERTEPFTMMHCWKKLHNEPKWINKFLELNNSKSVDGMSCPPTKGHAESGNENIDTSWPEGCFLIAPGDNENIETSWPEDRDNENIETSQPQDRDNEDIDTSRPEDRDNENIDTSRSEDRDNEKRNVSRRGTAFSKEEDLVVCSAFLNISKKPIIGVDQTSGGYYKRMHDFFNKHKPEGSNRSQIAVQHRWALIQKAMNKFCGHKAAIDRLNESDKNEQDRIDDAVAAYERTEPFTMMHCWKKLHNEPKWINRFLELNTSKSVDGMSAPPTQGHAESGNENIDTARPEGRDNENIDTSPPEDRDNENIDTSPPEGRNSAKRRRSKSFTKTSSSSTAAEVLQRLQEKSEKTEQKQDQQMAEILRRKDEKIRIQRDLFNLQKKHMKMTLQQQKKENKIREKEAEARLIMAESSIISVDMEKVPPHLKNYYIGMQRKIMESRGFINPSNNKD